MVAKEIPIIVCVEFKLFFILAEKKYENGVTEIASFASMPNFVALISANGQVIR